MSPGAYDESFLIRISNGDWTVGGQENGFHLFHFLRHITHIAPSRIKFLSLKFFSDDAEGVQA